MTNKNEKIEGLQLRLCSLTCTRTTPTFTHRIALLCRFFANFEKAIEISF